MSNGPSSPDLPTVLGWLARYRWMRESSTLAEWYAGVEARVAEMEREEAKD